MENQKTILIVIVVAVIVALATGWLVYFWNSSSFEKQKQELSNQINNLQKTISDLQSKIDSDKDKPADPMANWQTYKNEEYGFEFKYPMDWSVEVSEDPYDVMVFPEGFEKDKRAMALAIDPVNVGRESVFDIGANVNIQNTVFGGNNKAYIYSCPEQNQCPEQLSYAKSIKVIDLPKNWTNYNEIEYGIYKGYEDLHNTFELVLASIKF